MTQVLTCLVVYGLIMALTYWKPNAGRIFLGIFFLLMAWGVNVTVTLLNPNLFIDLGANAFMPFYRPLFTGIVGAHPLLWGMAAIIYETTTGLLLLSRGVRVKIGAFMGIIFLIGITPFGEGTLVNPVLMLPLHYLTTREFSLSLLDYVRPRLAHR